jgi:cobaltochelatase CobS
MKVKEALRQQLMARNAALEANAKEAAAAAPAAEEEKEVEVVCGANQVLFSSLIPDGKRALKKRKLIDFAVTVFKPEDAPAQIRAFIPTVDSCYNIQIEQAHSLLFGWELGEKVLITGPTGSGKSSLVQYACAVTGRPFIRINMTGDMESSTLMGSLIVESGATIWKDGPVTEACRYGAVCLIDEWDVTPPEILFSMQWLFEEDGKLLLKEMPGDSASKFITPDANFRLVCGGNTVGQGDDTGRYSGTNVQNNASIDRFQTTIKLDYLEQAHEVKLIYAKYPKLKAGIAEKMVSFANLVRTACQQNNINLTMSPRTLLSWSKKSVAFNNVSYALQLAFMNKLRDSDRKVVAEFYKKVFGASI